MRTCETGDGRPPSVGRVLTSLAQTPQRITEITARLGSPQLHAAPGPDEWSANDVLAHLRACADVWGGSVVRILAEDGPTIRAVNPRTWINETDYLEQRFHPSLAAFARQRHDLLTVLEPLSPGSWSRSATITGAGKVLQWTVLFYAQRLARHERGHLRQFEGIARTVSLAGSSSPAARLSVHERG